MDAALSSADVLIGSELEIRVRDESRELGPSRMLRPGPTRGSRLHINAGALRINRDLAAGSALTRREVEELLPYPSATQRVRLDRPTLEAVLERSVRDWTGKGHWLQVAGVAFRHEPSTQSVRDITLLGPDGPRPLGEDESVEAVTVTYLTTAATGQDGYTMLGAETIVGEPGAEVKALVVAGLEAAGATGIHPQVEGRVCNAVRGGPCLAVTPEAPAAVRSR